MKDFFENVEEFMKKEENKELLDNLTDSFNKFLEENGEDIKKAEFKKEKEKLKKAIDKGFEDAEEVVVFITDKYITTFGSKVDILSSVGGMLSKMLDDGDITMKDIDILFNGIKEWEEK